MISGRSSRGGPFDEPRELLADDRAHAAHDEGRIGDAEGHAAGADHAGAGQRGVAQAGPLLLGLEPLGVGLLVGELERVGRHQLGVPLLERAFVEHLLRCGRWRRDVQVVVALRADAQQPLGFLAVDRLAAVFAAEPQSVGHASLFAHRLGLRGSRVGFAGGHGRR